MSKTVYPQLVIYVPHEQKEELDLQLEEIERVTGKSRACIVREAIVAGLPMIYAGVTGGTAPIHERPRIKFD